MYSSVEWKEKRGDYSDVDLDKFASENMNSNKLKYQNRPVKVDKSIKKVSHPNINHVVVNNSDNTISLCTIKSINKQKDRDEIKAVEQISKFDLLVKSFFVRSTYANSRIYMDHFPYDLVKFYGDYPYRYNNLQAGTELFKLMLQAVSHLRKKGMCHTDIKMDQVLIRPYNKNRGSYYNVVYYEGNPYEVAIADLDIPMCHRDEYVLTFRIPDVVFNKETRKHETEKQTLWGLGVYGLEIMGIDIDIFFDGLDYGDINKIYSKINHKLNELRAKNIPQKYKDIIIDCFRPESWSWDLVVSKRIDINPRPISKRV